MEDFELMFSMSSDDSDEFEDELLILLLKRRLRRRKRRTIWISKIRKLRTTYGVFHVLLPQMTDVEYKQYLRVSRDNFEIIHDFIKHDVQKQHTKFREPISIQERLAICLRFLALGETYRDLAFHFRVGESTVSIIIKEVCDSIWDKMQSKFLLEPNEDFWKRKPINFIADGISKIVYQQ